MGAAYTPGLTVSADHVTLKRRSLPIEGEILVSVGDRVRHDTVVARVEFPGEIETVRLAERLQLDAEELAGKLRVEVGDAVKRGQLLAETAGLFGLFHTEVHCPVDGTVEFFTNVTGHLGIRRPPRHMDVNAYAAGEVVDVDPKRSVQIRTRGAFIQGILGVGGEQFGEIRPIVDAPDAVVTDSDIHGDLSGKVLIAGAHMSGDAVLRAAEAGAVGIVVGAMNDRDLAQVLGYDIGVAVTGDEDIPLTIVLTEGFGSLPMATRTFDLLASLQGRFAAMNGATQIRAGAIRPEILVQHDDEHRPQTDAPPPQETAVAAVLEVGTPIRAVRHPHFGRIGRVAALPPEPVKVPSGSVLRVLEMTLPDGGTIIIPRSNVEILEGYDMQT